MRLWISILIPKIKESNNVGVSVHDQTLEDISKVENNVCYFFGSFEDYYEQRAKLITKVCIYLKNINYNLLD